ncbi:hypothetical protein B9Z55_026358 [Caenorhabditis nigoni]|uniref:ATP-dependent DNA helicase n=1 Tax=Caenorhabditis nigoni TaxID=1611254 RepID=A0A2G5T327_9PELO|nr:hypothetical protein B9Z55_026358 [Caenorhabditis nigoni]
MQAEGEPLAPIVVDGHPLPPKSCAMNRWVMGKLPTCAANPFYVLVHGQAGSGKSLLLKSIAYGVRNHFQYGDACIVIAPVAMAANRIGGKTIHSTFILKWGPTTYDDFMEEATDQILENLSWMKEAKILVIDNINFVGAVDFARIDHRLQQVTGVEKPFGGLSVIVFGDFHQVKPVDGLWIFEDLEPEYEWKAQRETPHSPAKLWSLFKIVELESKNWRAEIEEQKFFDFMRDGFEEEEEELREYLKDSCFVCWDINETLDTLVNVYFQNIYYRQNYDFVFLCVNDEIASDINAAIAERLGNKVFKPQRSNGDRFAKKWNTGNEVLIVSIGSPVVLLESFQNINAGAIGHVEDFTNHEITVRFPNDGFVSIQRLEYEYEFERFQQFPLRLAYAHTIESAQGATFDGIILVRNHTWSQEEKYNWKDIHEDYHGQLYTAMSRCRSIENCGIIPMRWLQWVCAPEVLEELERMRRDNSLRI